MDNYTYSLLVNQQEAKPYTLKSLTSEIRILTSAVIKTNVKNSLEKLLETTITVDANYPRAIENGSRLDRHEK